jgi:hypothetical protein
MQEKLIGEQYLILIHSCPSFQKVQLPDYHSLELQPFEPLENGKKMLLKETVIIKNSSFFFFTNLIIFLFSL